MIIGATSNHPFINIQFNIRGLFMKSYSDEIVTKEQLPPKDNLIRISAILSLVCIGIMTILSIVFAYGVYHYDVIHFMDNLNTFLNCPKK